MEEILMKKMMKKANDFVTKRGMVFKAVIAENRGEGYIDSILKILIAVVLGSLLLAGLYTLMGEQVLPTLQERIMEIFNYAG
jgi:hypothetical protein